MKSMGVRKFVALYEMIGGMMFFVAIFMYATTSELRPQSLLQLTGFLVIASFLGILNIIAGIKLWQNKPSGFKLSLIAQALQSISIKFESFYLVAFAPFAYILGISKSGIYKIISLGSEIQTNFSAPDPTVSYIGFNLGALTILALLNLTHNKKLDYFKLFGLTTTILFLTHIRLWTLVLMLISWISLVIVKKRSKLKSF